MTRDYIAMIIFSKSNEPAIGYFWGMGCLHHEYFIYRDNEPMVGVVNFKLENIREACTDSLTLYMLEGKELVKYSMTRELLK